jgi:uncharacterized protein YqeY
VVVGSALAEITLSASDDTPRVTGMSLRLRLRQALPESMRARDKVAVRALRSTLAALDNAEAVPGDDDGCRSPALEQSPVGVGVTEVVRRELSEDRVVEVVRAEVAERLDAAAQLPATTQAERAEQLRAEAAVLLRFLDDPGSALSFQAHLDEDATRPEEA